MKRVLLVLGAALLLAIAVGAFLAATSPVHLKMKFAPHSNEPLSIHAPAQAQVVGHLPEGMLWSDGMLNWPANKRQPGDYVVEMLWGPSWRPSRATFRITIQSPWFINPPELETPRTVTAQPPPIEDRPALEIQPAPETPPAALFKVGCYGDSPQTIQELGDGMLLGLSQTRLMIFRGDLREIVSSYWTPCRSPRTFLYYKGCVFLGQDEDGLDILDVRDGKTIRPLARIPVPIRSNRYAAITGETLIIPGQHDYSLYFFSIADPAKPQQIAKLFMGVNKNPYSVRIHGTIAYVHGHRYIAAVDFANPKEPRKLSEVETSTEGVHGAFVACPPYLYLFGRERLIVDATQPGELKIAQTTIEKDVRSSLAFLRGPRALLYGDFGVHELDLAEPLKPRAVRSYPRRVYQLGAGPDGIYQTLADGSVKRLAGGPLPDERPDQNGVRYDFVAAHGKLAYVIGTTLEVIDLADPRYPRLLNRQSLSKHTSSRDAKPLIANGMLVTGSGIWDLQEPQRPRLTKPWQKAVAFATEGPRVYVLRGSEIECWVSGADAPQCTQRWKIDVQAHALAVRGEYLYAGVQRPATVRTYRIAGDRLEFLNEFAAPGKEPYLGDMKLGSDFLYLALSGPGVACLSLGDPGKPQYHSHYDTNQFAEALQVRNGIVYVADGSGGVNVIDLRTIGEGTLIAKYPTTDWTPSLDITGELIIACDRESGVQVFACALLSKGPSMLKPQPQPKPTPLKPLPLVEPSKPPVGKPDDQF